MRPPISLPKIKKYNAVESFFNEVVDKVILASGYDKYEVGVDPGKNLFVNVEIFKQIQYSSLVIIDLTGVRPNCCIEFGYALGLHKKILLLAAKGTKLPWDINSIKYTIKK